MAVQHLTNRNPDGTNLGYDTNDKIAFYGVTPAAQISGATQAAVDTTAIAAVTAVAAVQGTVWGYASSAQCSNLVAAVNLLVTQSAANMVLVNKLRADLVTLGLIAGA